MGLKATQMQLALVLLIALARIGTVATDQALRGCRSTCGSVSIPYPFGIGNSSGNGAKCFLEEKMELTCNDTDSTLYRGHGNVQILNITLDGKMDMLAFISKVCKNESVGGVMTKGNNATLRVPAFPISSEDNKFVTVGCDSYGYLNNYREEKTYSTGCLTRCDSMDDMQSMQRTGNCTGIGCCQVDIPPGMKEIGVQAFSFQNFNSSYEFNNCSYSFVVKNGNYTFKLDDLRHLQLQEAPFVVDWTVGDNVTCGAEGKPDYACKGNSYCENWATGYRCKCQPGYDGNPYHPDGCKDIDECKTENHTCISVQNCFNTNGSHQCFCPKGQSGNGTKEVGCHQQDVVTKVVIGVGAAIVTLFVGTTSLYLIYQKRKLTKLREKYFQQNGGSILLQQLSTIENSQIAQIFTEEQLKKATTNFDENLIIGKGGFGTVFKGYLADDRIVAVKKSKIVDKSQKEQFINEVIVLSQINHRNVVKLLGCCLETEVPLLVYEFVDNGTLFDFIHTERKVNNETWKSRLRIAAEAAGALSYLHSAASIPIIHRDVKTANILLDNTYTAKVSDFGASRLVPLDQTEIATMVQGTFGYLDPEYMLTSQLTEKSDVYSFGIVLIELLTGEKPHSFGKPEEKKSLAIHFLTCLKEDRLFDVLQVGIVNEENKKEIMEVAILAAKCLRLNGEERPSMKEVAMELEGIRLMEKHPWINTDQNLDETQHLLHEASSSIHEPGDSSGYQYSGYDSIRDHVLVALDDGR